MMEGMSGKMRDIILGLYLTGLVVYLSVITTGYIRSGLDFDAWKGEYLGGLALFLGLLIKLPMSNAEVKAAENNGTTTTENMEVVAEGDVTVKPS